MSLWLLIPVMVISWGVGSLVLAALIGRGLRAAENRWPGASSETGILSATIAPTAASDIAAAKWAIRSPRTGTNRLTV